jgi:hypothetical protein
LQGQNPELKTPVPIKQKPKKPKKTKNYALGNQSLEERVLVPQKEELPAKITLTPKWRLAGQ